MGHDSEDHLSSSASIVRAAVLAFAASGGDIADAATAVSGTARDRHFFVEAADAIDVALLASPEDACLRRGAQLIDGLLRADIWLGVRHLPFEGPTCADERIDDELEAVRGAIRRLLDRRFLQALDALDAGRWTRLTKREALLLAERRALAACA